MIICSCNVISSANIQLTIERLVAEDKDAMITPGAVYHAMGLAPNCRGCLPHFAETVYFMLDDLAEAGRYLPPAKPIKRKARNKSARHDVRDENFSELSVTA